MGHHDQLFPRNRDPGSGMHDSVWSGIWESGIPRRCVKNFWHYFGPPATDLAHLCGKTQIVSKRVKKQRQRTLFHIIFWHCAFCCRGALIRVKTCQKIVRVRKCWYALACQTFFWHYSSLAAAVGKTCQNVSKKQHYSVSKKSIEQFFWHCSSTTAHTSAAKLKTCQKRVKTTLSASGAAS